VFLLKKNKLLATSPFIIEKPTETELDVFKRLSIPHNYETRASFQSSIKTFVVAK